MNCSARVTSINVSDDSSLLGAGFSDSVIKMWTLLPHKLKKLKHKKGIPREELTNGGQIRYRKI